MIAAREAMDNQDKASALLKRYNELKANRSTWEQQYQEIDELVSPAPNNFNSNNPTPGMKVNQKLFDPTATQALNRFVAAISATLTPRSARWHRLTTPDMKDDKEVNVYLDSVTNLLFDVRYAPQSNFASQIDECYQSLGKFGTACMFIDDDLGRGIRYRAIHLSEIYIAESADGHINTVFRKFKYTAAQAVEAFGTEVLPEKIITKAETSPDYEFCFIHAVYPNDKYTGLLIDEMPIVSCYICEDTKTIIRESGYRTMPYAVSRYRKEAGEMYGRSPAMDVLPEIKTLNRMRKANIFNIERLANPPMLASDEAAELGVNMQPGTVNYGLVNENGQPMLLPFNSGANINLSDKEIDQMRKMINDVFLVTLFQIMVQTPEMTATEVQYRQQEKGEMLAPTMGRQQSELLSRIIERELDILSMANVLPPMPDVLLQAGGILDVQYEAPLNKIMRSNEATATLQALQTAAGLAQFDPSVLKMFNMEESMRIICDIWGVPASIIKSPQEIQAMKAQDAQQAQLQQVLQAAPEISQSAKNIADAQQAFTAAKPSAGI